MLANYRLVKNIRIELIVKKQSKNGESCKESLSYKCSTPLS